MIVDSDSVVRPEWKLAGLALAERLDPAEAEAIENSTKQSGGLGNIGGLPIAGPMLPPGATSEPEAEKPITEQADSVMGDDDAKSNTSTTAMVDITEIKPEPPSRPPPVPPRPQASAQADATKVKIERNAQQQDAAEIMNNIFDLLSCALKGEGVLPRDGEQDDLIKQLFFSDLTTVRDVGGKITSNSAIQDNHLVSPGNRNRPLYAALDDEFSRTEVENGASEDTTKTFKHEFIEKASPIQIINVRRLVFEDGRAKKDESQVGLDEDLYLDRYLKRTDHLSEDELQTRRKQQWNLQQRLRALETRKKTLQQTRFKMSLPDAVEETAVFLEHLSKASEEQLVDVDEDSIPNHVGLPAKLREQAQELQKEIESFDQQMDVLDKEINSIFSDCRDHRYRLHAVFMHRGSASGGHYWIYIYDFQHNLWRKYNDEKVDLVDREEVFMHETSYPQTSTGIVYIREDLVSEYTEAVHRRIPVPLQSTNEIEMKDIEPEYEDIEILNGIEKE